MSKKKRHTGGYITLTGLSGVKLGVAFTKRPLLFHLTCQVPESHSGPVGRDQGLFGNFVMN